MLVVVVVVVFTVIIIIIIIIIVVIIIVTATEYGVERMNTDLCCASISAISVSVPPGSGAGEVGWGVWGYLERGGSRAVKRGL